MAASNNKKIVIVDDEVSFLKLFGDVLSKNGFRVVKFSDPKEALIKIVEEKPDLVLLDVAMPDVNGLEFFEHLKNDFKEKMPKVVFLSNFGEIGGAEIDRNFAKNIGAADYIRKTSDLDSVVASIRKILSEK